MPTPAEKMVTEQLLPHGVTDERVLDAMRSLPREEFLSGGARRHAYEDRALAIECGQTISQPLVVALMTQSVNPQPDDVVLEVGTGSGYAAAVISRCCREVVSVERHAALADRARAILAELGYDNVEVRVGDGAAGAPDRAPYGGISVTAAAEGEPPRVLLDQLAPGAALVCPVRRPGGEDLMRFRNGREETVVPVRFVPLVAEDDEA